MNKLLIIAIITLSLSLNVLAGKNSALSIVVPLTAGSFQIDAKKVRGTLKKVGEDSYKASKLYVKVKDMKTGMDLRDEHMKSEERLNEKKFPKVIMTKIKAQGGQGTGIISIKGKKQKIKFKYSTKGKYLTAKFKIDPTKFPLKKLKYLGVGVDGELKITAKVKIK